jgi:hypothetical protein
MGRLTPEKVEQYLETYGWSFHAESDLKWVTGWQGEQRSYPLTISLTETWILLQVKPLLRADVEWENWGEVLRHMLELNNDCHMVRLSLDEYGDIILSMQLFSTLMPYDEFSDALGVLGHYAEILYEDLAARLSELGHHSSIPQEYLT